MNSPKIEPIGKDRYRLVDAFNYATNDGGIVSVPAGYLTNGADIPKFFWRLYPPFSPEYLPAVIVHDYLCDRADEYILKDARKTAFKFADDVFKEMLIDLGVSKIKVSLFYNAVRLYHKIRS